MLSPKERIASLVAKIPQNATREDVIHRLVFFCKVEEGLRDIEEGHVIDDDKLDEFLGNEGESETPVVHGIANGPDRRKKIHREGQTKSREKLRQKAKSGRP
jgi:hypothetical protein